MPETIGEASPNAVEQAPRPVAKENGRRAGNHKPRRRVLSERRVRRHHAEYDVDREATRGRRAGPVREKLEEAGIRAER